MGSKVVHPLIQDVTVASTEKFSDAILWRDVWGCDQRSQTANDGTQGEDTQKRDRVF